MNIGSKTILVNKIIGIFVLFFLATSVYGHDVVVKPLGTSVENGVHHLKIGVWNCTNKDIVVPIADLPWGQYRLGLVLYPGGKLAGDPLKESMPIGDSPSTGIKIPAKSHVEGDIVLDQRFSDIARYKNYGNLLIFWEYDLSLITGGKPEIVGGMVHLDGKISSDAQHLVACK